VRRKRFARKKEIVDPNKAPVAHTRYPIYT
jgi:hypothetical protein